MTEYRREIDGLRAVAIVSVIVHHFDRALLASGHLGVDIFFVISGYVITAALYRRRNEALGTFLLDFYARRLKRLAPALAACVLLTGIALCLVDPDPRRSLETGISALFGLSNLYLMSQAADYFATPAQLNVFTQTWSLGVEEQFYFLFPALLWFTGFRSPWSGGADFRRLALPGLALVSLLAFLVIARLDPTVAFYLMPTRFWELGAGAVCFFARDLGALPATPRRGVATAALAAMMLPLFAPLPIAMYSTLVVVAGTAVLICSVSPGSLADSILSHPIFVGIGKISYSLYLWHWTVLVLGRWTIGTSAGSTAVQAVLLVILALASYSLVEAPLRRANWSRSAGKTILIGVGMLSGVAALLSLGMDGRLYSGNRLGMMSTGAGSLTKVYRVPGQTTYWLGTRCIIAGNADIGKHLSLADCTLGEFATARRRVLVLGDSFSAAFVPGFDDLVKSRGYAVSIASSWGASPAPGVEIGGSWSKSSHYYWTTVAPELISQLRAGDVVFLVSDLAGYSPPQASLESKQELEGLRQSLEAFSAQLAQRQIRLVMLHANPPAREANCDPATALPQWFRPANACGFITRKLALERRQALDSMLHELSLHKRLGIVDLMGIFCPSEHCSYLAKDGQLLYRDANSHPSVEAVKLSEPRIRDALLAATPLPDR